VKLRPNDLIIRCYAEKVDGLWVGVCIDLSLAAQGDSFKDVRRKLDEQIKEYVFDALGGEDRQFAVHLLKRRAPLSQCIRYYIIKWSIRLHRWRNGDHSAFKDTLPLIPAC
jgi:hypothetical protein